ncbi:hypothetical protein [Marinobacter subterrani]|uniref:hypothetical protein n=1 Tax=Marinobacter subterrani TaxID=1658765 RepID=UPI0023528241|nr:hypothetical protein [Marinobacter subterrani]
MADGPGAVFAGWAAEVIQHVKALASGKETRELKKKYQALPAGLRSYVEQTDYFGKPFDDLAILRDIDDGDQPYARSSTTSWFAPGTFPPRNP